MISPSRSTLLPTVTFSHVPGASDTGYPIGQTGVHNGTVYTLIRFDGDDAVWVDDVHTNEDGQIVGPILLEEHTITQLGTFIPPENELVLDENGGLRIGDGSTYGDELPPIVPHGYHSLVAWEGNLGNTTVDEDIDEYIHEVNFPRWISDNDILVLEYGLDAGEQVAADADAVITPRIEIPSVGFGEFLPGADDSIHIMRYEMRYVGRHSFPSPPEGHKPIFGIKEQSTKAGTLTRSADDTSSLDTLAILGTESTPRPLIKFRVQIEPAAGKFSFSWGFVRVGIIRR